MEEKGKKEPKQDIDTITADNFFVATQAVKEMSDNKKDGD